MPPRRRKRLDPSAFALPIDAIREGHYAELYFLRAREIVRSMDVAPRVLTQVTCTSAGILSGIDEAIAILRSCTDDWSALVVHALYEGDRVDAWDTVLTIEGPYDVFAHLESLIVGVLARRTGIASRARTLVDAARPKPVMILSARDDHWLMQPGDGFAAFIGGVKTATTAAQGAWWSGTRVGAVPHSLIAAHAGDTLRATRALAECLEADVPLIAPVDYENDAVRTSLVLARALEGRLWGVRLETSDYLVDHSILPEMGSFPPTGVNPQLVWNVRNALDAEGFGDVKIVASGGFSTERLRVFEEEGVPVDAYGIGAALLAGRVEFTADIVQVDGQPEARVGRTVRQNPRLERVK